MKIYGTMRQKETLILKMIQSKIQQLMDLITATFVQKPKLAQLKNLSITEITLTTDNRIDKIKAISMYLMLALIVVEAALENQDEESEDNGNQNDQVSNQAGTQFGRQVHNGPKCKKRKQEIATLACDNIVVAGLHALDHSRFHAMRR